MESNFNFWMPLEIDLQKSGKGKTQMRIKGIASTADIDTDQEVLEPAGFILDRLTKSGYFNYDHRAKENPMYIVGEPDKAEIRNGQLYVEGNLYDTPLAKDIWNFASTLQKSGSTRKLGFSIEGKALERDPFNQKRITKALLTGIAITPHPKNSNTLMDVVKGEGYKEYEFDIEKSIQGNPILIESFDKETGNIYSIDTDLKINKTNISEIKKSIEILTIAATKNLLNTEQKEKFKKFLFNLKEKQYIC